MELGLEGSEWPRRLEAFTRLRTRRTSGPPRKPPTAHPPSLSPSRRAWEKTSSPPGDAWRSRRDRTPPGRPRGGWPRAQRGWSASTSLLPLSRGPPAQGGRKETVIKARRIPTNHSAPRPSFRIPPGPHPTGCSPSAHPGPGTLLPYLLRMPPPPGSPPMHHHQAPARFWVLSVGARPPEGPGITRDPQGRQRTPTLPHQ